MTEQPPPTPPEVSRMTWEEVKAIPPGALVRMGGQVYRVEQIDPDGVRVQRIEEANHG